MTNGVSERLLSAECRVFKSKIEKFYDEGKQYPKIDPLNTVTSKLLKFFKNNNTPTVLSMLYKSSHRRGQLIYRKACLAYLQFEKVLTRKLTFAEFVAEWKEENIVLLWYRKKHFC